MIKNATLGLIIAEFFIKMLSSDPACPFFFFMIMNGWLAFDGIEGKNNKEFNFKKQYHSKYKHLM